MNLFPSIIERRLSGPRPCGTISRRARRLAAMLWIVLAVGCQPPVGIVTGTVSYKGEKVPSGTVSFVSGGKVREGDIHDGAYTVTNVPVGEAKIAVVRFDPQQADPYQALNNVRKTMIQGHVSDPRELDPQVVTDPWQLAALQEKRLLLPPAYGSPETSGLRCTVTAGTNTLNMQLQEKPKRERPSP